MHLHAPSLLRAPAGARTRPFFLIPSDMARTHAFVASILDVVQLSEDLKLVLEGQIEPNLSSSVNHEQAALNAQLIQDCEHMAREIDMLEKQLEDQKPRTELRPESHPGTPSSQDTKDKLSELQNLEEDNRSGVCVRVQKECVVYWYQFSNLSI